MKKTDAVKRDMARAMVDTGFTYREVAEKLGIGIGTVHSIVVDKTEDLTPLARSIRRKFATRCLMMADQVLDGITKYNIGSAPLQQQIISIAILLDKAEKLESAQTPQAPPETSEHLNRDEGE